jgi:hypothetical protein
MLSLFIINNEIIHRFWDSVPIKMLKFSEALVGGGAGLGAGLPQHGTQQQNRQLFTLTNLSS